MHAETPLLPPLRLRERPAPWAARTRCPVCDFAEMRTDLVAERGMLVLRECPRCEHRSTEPVALPVGPLRRRPAPSHRVA